MGKRVFIVHGWEATPESNWFPWFARELKTRGYEVEIPAMPHTENPVLEEWLAHLKIMIGTVDQNTYLIGHSLGTITILRFLEALPPEEKAGGALLVAGFSEPVSVEELQSFYAEPLDYGKVKRSVRNITVIHAQDDPVVSVEFGKNMAKQLDAELILMVRGGHLNLGDGFGRFPTGLGALLTMSEGNR